MSDPVKGLFISEYGNDRPKALKLYAAILTSVLIVVFSWPILSNHLHDKYIFVAITLIAFVPIIFSFSQYLYQLFRFKAYRNGMEISGLGFFEWKDIRIGVNENHIFMIVKNMGHLGPKKKVLNENINFHATAHTDFGPVEEGKTPHLVIVSALKPFLSINTAENFFISFQTYLPSDSIIKINQAQPDTVQRSEAKKKFWRKILLGNEQPTVNDYIKNFLAAFVTFGLFYCFIYSPSFYFSTIFKYLFIAISVCLGLFGTYKVYEKNAFQEQRLFARLFMYIFSAFLYPAIIYIGFFVSPAAIITQYSGSNFKGLIYYPDKNLFFQSNCGYHVKGTFAKGSLLKPICISRTHYQALPPEGGIAVSGHQSILGRTIEHYNYKLSPEIHNLAVKDSAELEQQWKQGL